MMTVLILLLGSQEIDLLKSMISKWRKRKYIVFYDRDCGFCHLTARILKRMDGFSRLKWADRLLEGNRPEKLDKLLETTIVVWDPETNQIWTRHRGFERIISAIPLGFLFSWIFILPGLEKLFGMIYDWISRNRTFVSKTLGVPACGIPREESPQSIVGEKKYNSNEIPKVFLGAFKYLWSWCSCLELWTAPCELIKDLRRFLQ